ncbi:pyrroloquinoline quinone biosynthesis peptide chaperone PqqD [Paraburkholderia elongata]|uniref:Pyrroloquinoline quinone biosynthesis peptide chaperone PqqD n=1 Tax=Paraburkholderia elongata TaxID=2675747 RepID=A0A972SH99_9BURK|nr:pyrroloquinoline quinone biosynthesis peptide chaperone PqqD [Paraburkholderia elongata]NPT54687.1 pyrroloquinoline quinone biosynthesis peptide chaperone PqqD [Paraburkholderia elongata]
MNATVYAADETSSAYRPKIRTLFRLQWEPAQNAHVLLYPEGMVKLNQSAAEILKRCDGTHDLDTLIADLEQEFNAIGIATEVHVFVADARTRGWLE